MSVLEKLERRIFEITFQEKLSHLSSCLSALPIVHEIYEQKGNRALLLHLGYGQGNNRTLK